MSRPSAVASWLARQRWQPVSPVVPVVALVPAVLVAVGAAVIDSWLLGVLALVVGLVGLVAVACAAWLAGLAMDLHDLREQMAREELRSHELAGDLRLAFEQLARERETTTHLRVALGIEDPSEPPS